MNSQTSNNLRRLRAVRDVLLVVFVVLVMTMSWFAVPSAVIFQPISWVYDPSDGKATFTRIVKTGSPAHVRWSHIVYAPGRTPCSAGGIRIYDNRIQVERFDVYPELRECLNTPGNVAVLSWWPLLFGRFPLQPAVLMIPPDSKIPPISNP